LSEIDISIQKSPEIATPRELAALESEVKELFFEIAKEALGKDYELYPTDPANFILKMAAKLWLLFIQQINDSGKNSFIAFTEGNPLYQIASRFGQNVSFETDPETGAPRPSVPDEVIRQDIRKAFDGISTAGPEASYEYHAKRAPGIQKEEILDIKTYSPDGDKQEGRTGRVNVTILFKDQSKLPAEEITRKTAAISSHLSSRTIRPINDILTVKAAQAKKDDKDLSEEGNIPRLRIKAEVKIPPGVDPSIVLKSARESVLSFAESSERIGFTLSKSAITGAIYAGTRDRKEGPVRFNALDIKLTSPAQDILAGPDEYPLFDRVKRNVDGVEVETLDIEITQMEEKLGA
jgi:phage-related baseplate assembly protein